MVYICSNPSCLAGPHISPSSFPVTVGKLIKQAAKEGQIALASLEKKEEGRGLFLTAVQS